ncbi:hypothetical protein AB3464_25090 [Pseudomonas asplenii]|uniref:hypothetical protein n=1 Tax=Pseudomonas asplenii TaxID=53407 RepID=UPI0037C69F9C
MMALRVVLAASALYVSMASASSTPLKDDLGIAKSNQALANALWTRNHDACMTRDTGALAEVMRSANDHVHTQRSPATTYSGCRSMLTDVLFLNGACYAGKLTQDELDHARRNWEQDSATCTAQIASPALTPEEQSEAEWEAERRKEGATDDEIQAMSAIRHL